MDALGAATRAISRHGVPMVYTQVQTGLYDPELARPAVVETSYTLTIYPKQFIANQYNYPALVGKETIMFYLSNTSALVPRVNDEVQYKGKKYKVQSVQEHFANGAIALYKLIGVRG